MIGKMYILAARGVDDLINIIVLVALVAISILVRVGKKWFGEYIDQKDLEERRQRRAAEGKTDQEPARQPAARRPEPRPVFPEPVARTMPKPHSEPKPVPIDLTAREPIPVPAELIASPAKPIPSPLPQPQPRRLTVEQEISRLQSRLRKLEHVRQRRLAVHTPAEADTQAIEARLVSITPAQAAGMQIAAPALAGVNLSEPTAARAAIVFHEILSPAKAIRNTPEMWDM